METALLLGAAGLGAYIITQATRNEVEAMATVSDLAYDTKPSSMADLRLSAEKTRTPDRDLFLENVNATTSKIPDPFQPTYALPKFYNFPRKEQLSAQRPEFGVGVTEAGKTLSRKYEKERLGTTSTSTFKDYKNSKGQIVDSFSTGQIPPERQTRIEAIVNQPKIADLWQYEPHVVRVNDDVNRKFMGKDALGRSVVVQPQDKPPEFKSRPQQTFRRQNNDETTWLRPLLTNSIRNSFTAPATVDQGMNRDRSEERTHISIATPCPTADNYPRIHSTPAAEFARKAELLDDATINRPMITPQWDGKLTWKNMQVDGTRSKYETYQNTSVFTRPGVQGNRGWRQFDIESQYRRLGDAVVNDHSPDIAKTESPMFGYGRQQFEARKPGPYLQDITTWTAAYGGERAMDRYTKPFDRGLAPGGALSSCVADNPLGDLDIVPPV